MEREDHLFEELCKKGKAYRAKRMAAGEKSSAYLSGRAVKVCKGQMSGKKKKKRRKKTNEGSDARDKASMMFDKMKVGDIIKTSKGEFKKIDDKHFEKVGKPGRKFTSKQMTFIKENLKSLEVYEEIDALHENETYCPKCATKIKEAIREEIEKVAKTTVGDEMEKWLKTKPFEKDKKPAKEAKTKPAKGKRFAKKVKNPKTGRTRTVSYGQAGKAKKGGDRIRPGTAKGHAYCARSAKIKKCKNPPCANTLSRKKWKCQGSRSVK